MLLTYTAVGCTSHRATTTVRPNAKFSPHSNNPGSHYCFLTDDVKKADNVAQGKKQAPVPTDLVLSYNTMAPIDSVCSTAEESKAKSQRWSSTKQHHHQQHALIPEVMLLPHNTPVGFSYMCVLPWHLFQSWREP